MRASACVGRIGGLAVALGIGAGIATGGIAVGWAAPAGASSMSADSATDTGSASAGNARPTPRGVSARRSVAARHSDSTPAVGPTSRPPTAAVRVDLSRLSNRTGPASATQSPVTAVATAPLPLSEPSGPGSPMESGASWVVLAAVRRSSQPEAAVATTESVSTGQLLATSSASKTTAAATTANPILAFFFNQAPTASPTQNSQSATGVVSGDLNVMDSDSETVSYGVVSNPARGAVAIDAAGRYTYTPDPGVAHDGTTDVFQVTVSDAGSGFHLHGLAGLINLLTFGLIGESHHDTTITVNVIVTPVNEVPVASVSVGSPDSSTGMVIGNVNAVDGDGDPLTYSGSTTTTKGVVVVAATGSFTYLPTATARHSAASLTATTAETTDAFTITVADDHGGSVDVPVGVAISPSNMAPVAIPNMGMPDAATGLVAGAVIGADADGDSLTYSGSTTTTKGSVVVAANGSFTYTPTALARHAAASATATGADTTDTFTVTVIDGHGGTVDVPVSVTISPAAVNFTFIYGTGSQYWSAESRSALESAAANVASYIVVGSPVTISYTVIGQNSPSSNFLASNYTNFTSSSPGYYGTVVQTKILTGVDSNGSAADSEITWNFAYPWALGDSVGYDQYDFQSVAMHEMVHSLGVLSGIGNPASMDRNWATYDSFLSTSDGTAVIGGSYTWDSAYTANLTGGNGGLYFDGPNAVSVYGGPVPLYTPGTWASGSSVVHLDPTRAPAGTTYLMDPSDGYGPGVRVITPVERGILRDLGYTISPGYAVFFIGFGFLRRRRVTPNR